MMNCSMFGGTLRGAAWRTIRMSLILPIMAWSLLASQTAAAAKKPAPVPAKECFAEWIFSEANEAMWAESWTKKQTIPSTSGQPATVQIVQDKRNKKHPLTCVADNHRAYVGGLQADDYWLFTFPVANLPAGAVFDFGTTMAGEAGSPRYFIVEYLDGGKWLPAEGLHSVPKHPEHSYTYRSSGRAVGKNYRHANVSRTIRFAHPVKGAVQVRCRVVGPYTCPNKNNKGEGRACMAPFGHTGARLQYLGTEKPKDFLRILCLGNSFSFHGHPVWMLKELAWREGHEIQLRAHLKGSQSMQNHLELDFSADAIKEGGYDVAFLQDQSQTPARYARDGGDSIVRACVELAGRVRARSPKCRMIVERTWAFEDKRSNYGGFGSMEAFDNYLEAGTQAMAKAANAECSPIGNAFQVAREQLPDINLYDTDKKHQSSYGAYLKACVNYLLLYGEPFGDNPADCGIEPEKAARLRAVAEAVVLKK